MDYTEIVKKLVGNVEPVGETHTDDFRFENLQQMTALIDELLHEVCEVAKQKDRHEYSISKAGRHAHGFIKHLIKTLEEPHP